MGVKGLWKLMLPIGRRISIETLSGQTLAIDASIWLTQFITAMRDPETGKVAQAAHLIGFFRRICRLYYHEIRPVFVFDGATPEIKRKEVLRRKRQRDVFASNLNDMTVQRMAKKLLSNNIYKAKLQLEKGNKTGKKDSNQDDAESVGGGAFVDGFNPGSQRQATPATIATNKTIRASAEDQKELEEILAEGPDVKQEEAAEVNDWDLPLAVAAAEEAKEIESEEYHLSRAGDDGFISEVVASLPSHKRKDAIEKARKAQRMRSRREFMPAAAKPQDFSNVQVKNFLRYCKLNQDIVSMAKKAASHEGTDGKAMASDLTTRIELLHESEEEYESDTTDTSNEDGPKSLLKEKLGLKKRLHDTLHRTDSISSDESWGGSAKKPQPLRKSPRKSTILYDSDESVPAHKHDRESSKNLIHIQDSSSEDDTVRSIGSRAPADRGVGSEVAAESPNDRDSAVAQELEDHQLARALQEEEDQHQSIVEVGGTIRHSDQNVVIGTRDPTRATPAGCAITALRRPGIPADEGSSDESIDWEDGEDTGAWREAPAASGAPILNKEVVESTNQEAHKIDGRPRQTANDTSSNSGDTRTQENSAALQQAQETASHLANWAGRAFKRAMKEAGEAPKFVDDAPGFTESLSAQSALHDNSGASSGPLPKQTSGSKVKRRATMQQPSIPKTNCDTGDVADLIDWSSARNRRDRDRDGLTDEMLVEAKQMLQLFGIPYVEAPAEAEATCVALEQLGLVNGIVYKNIFEEQRFAEAYKAVDAEREMGLGHNAMVALAMLLGSDYTEGVKGVGIVNAMEILKAFDVSSNLKEGLQRFGNWMDGFDPKSGVGHSEPSGEDHNTSKLLFHAQHRSARTRWETPNNFPSEVVMKAYLDPVVDRSEEPFSWGAPDVQNLIGFCEAHIGWSEEHIRRQLEPVVQAQRNGSRQTRIDSFMKYEDSIKFGEVKSKRLRKVLGLRGTSEQPTTVKPKPKSG